MLDGRSDSGFTIVEMIVSLVVMVIFATLLFQMFLVGTTQQGTVSARASAIDIAAINLSKIDSRDSPLLDGITCGSSNDLTANASAAGTNITFSHESTSGTNLPSGTGTVQKMVALFPRGCTNSMPVEIISTVEYNGETITRATYVN